MTLPDLDWHVPYLTDGLPGVGGQIRAAMEDFVVEEVPAYEPCGEGEHVYLRIEKRDLSTPRLIQQVAQGLGVSQREIGCAGYKDARAVTEQTLSVRGTTPEAAGALELRNARVLWAKRHTNKLRAGHLRGNRFTLRIRDGVEGAAERAAPILEQLAARGVPNGYGRQRFGNREENHLYGWLLLHDDWDGLHAVGVHHLSRRMRGFHISALQSALFNQLLTRRMRQGTLDDVLLGDVARKEDTGGMFTVEDVAAERPRVRAWEISATGPMFGYKMMPARDEAGALEQAVLEAAGLALEDFRAVRAKGTRRPLRYNPEDLAWHQEDGALVLTFFAPKGAYATMLLREVMK